MLLSILYTVMLIALQVTVKYSVLQKRMELIQRSCYSIGESFKRKQNNFGVIHRKMANTMHVREHSASVTRKVAVVRIKKVKCGMAVL